MTNDIKSTRRTSTGTCVSGRRRLRGVYFVSSGVAGTLTFRDGGGSGTTVLTISTPALDTHTDTVEMPGDGILCETDIHLTVSNVASATVFYE